jgi:putative ABC transport system permease protein
MRWPGDESMIAQTVAVTRINLETLRLRVSSSVVIIVGIACFAGVFAFMLTLPYGFMRTIAANSEPDRAIVISADAELEAFSNLPRETAAAVADAPGILHGEDGKPILSDEAFLTVPASRKPDGVSSFVPVRGVGAKLVSLRPEIKLVAGRMFRPGTKELMAGVTAQDQFQGMEIGGKVPMPDGDWTIVGAFESRQNAAQARLVGDAETLMSAFKRNSFSSVTVRLERPDDFGRFSNALLNNPAIKVRVEREADYYARITRQAALTMLWMTYFVGAMMGIGALFGAINTMYSVVSVRALEIATLRAIGFSGVSVIISVVTEALLLALFGAGLGIIGAWALSAGKTSTIMGALFGLRVTPAIVGVALAWVVMIALLGGLLPAIRAARLPVATALRAT